MKLKRIRTAAVSAALLLGTTTTGAILIDQPKADAIQLTTVNSGSYLDRFLGGGVQACRLLGCPMPGSILQNGAMIVMRCWTDKGGERWYKAYIPYYSPNQIRSEILNDTLYVRARYVRNPTQVGHC